MCARNLWMLTEASHVEEKEKGKLLRAGKPGLSLEGPNSARWKKRENTAQVRAEAREQSGSML